LLACLVDPDRRVCLQQLVFGVLVCVYYFCLLGIHDFNIIRSVHYVLEDTKFVLEQTV
jgi:hypothetical protein